MIKRNVWDAKDWEKIRERVWRNPKLQIELHIDDRGEIADIFYGADINHVNIIRSNKGVMRGNHYHKQSIQHMLMVSGSMEYWHKPVGSSEPAKCEVQKKWEILSTPPNEIHALRVLEPDTTFITFASGLRGGSDYEKDTFRVPSIIPEDK